MTNEVFSQCMSIYSVLGVKGSKGGEGEQRGAKGGEAYSILGFKVPTTCEYKKFDYHVKWSGVPTT